MYSVLIVDDISENISVLTTILEKEYSVRATTSGKVALIIAAKFKPDIILLDIIMPEMDGFEVCKELKQNPLTKNIPIIFVSSKDEDIDEAFGFTIGASDYIKKPFSPIVVKSRMKLHLSMANQRKELELRVQERTLELQSSRKEIVNVLSRAGEYKDNETGMHVFRVGEYCYLVAKEMGISEADAQLFREAAPIHDIGKIGIRDSILLKPGKLTSEEYEKMKEHCVIGDTIIGEQNSKLLKLTKILIMEHHEKVNGKGYPNGLKGHEISIFGKILSVCDVFDALTTERPYKKAWLPEDAFALMESEKGKHFDSEVVVMFISLKDKILEIMNDLR